MDPTQGRPNWLSRHEDVPGAEEALSLIESRRIAEVLERCTVVTGVPRHPLLQSSVPDMQRWDPRILLARGVPRRTIRLIRREMARCPRTRRFLHALSNELLHRIDNRRLPAGQVDEELVTQILARAMDGEFLRFWSMSSPDEQTQLLAVAAGGYPNFADVETVQSLMQRGLLAKIDGRFDVVSEALRHFLLTRSRSRLDAIQAARRQGSLWDSVLPSMIVLVGLILAFLMVSGGQAAELIAAGIAALVASLPAVNAVVSLIAKRSSAA